MNDNWFGAGWGDGRSTVYSRDAGLQGSMGYPDSHGQHRFGVLTLGKILRLEQDYRVIHGQRQQPKSWREENLRRKECLGQKLGKSFYLFSHCNFQIKQILPKGEKKVNLFISHTIVFFTFLGTLKGAHLYL